ncbi:MAG: alcohol dehydrogenase catalytic domain-containing protein [Planctomycetaceae bacterium]|nr:alcohol dehydrogenase catalytic domain-containing protein [Planctomycetaceae bacterium]
MKAVMAVAPGTLALGEIDIPAPGEFEALVRMDACAICNSTDQKLLHNEFCPGIFPVVLGHEVVGTVVEIGPSVRNFRAGDRVFRQRLGDQHVSGGGRSCWGGFAQYGLVSDEWARQGVPYGSEDLPHDQQKLLMNVPPALAAGMVTLMECLDCIAACGAGAGKSVAVVGSGPVAQALAMFARLLGAGPVWAFGRRAAAAERFATVSKIDGYASGADLPPAASKIVNAGGFDLAVEAVGSPEALHTCLRLAGAKGRVCVYGVAPQSAPFRPDQTQRANVAFVGAREGRAQKRLVEWVQQGKVDLRDWVSHQLPLGEFQKGFDLIASRQATKVVLLA